MIEIWNLIILNPIMNVMVVLANAFAGNFGLAIIFITIIIRLAMLPITLKQLKSTQAMHTIQPKLKELQKKYGNDRQKMSEATMKLYKEHGISPLGCIWPMLIQLPIWIALFQSIRQALAATPADLLSLSSHLYGWAVVNQTVPMDSNFLWLNLAQPDPYIILPILVGVTMWVQQKMTTQPNPDPSQKKANTMMQIMFPLLFAFIAYTFPSGLGVYFVISAIVGITIQYFVMGWGGFSRAKPVTTTYKQARKQVEEKVIDGKVADYMSDDEGEGEGGETSSYWGKKEEPPQTQVQRKGRKDGRIRSRRKNRR
ncbi:YidC/Oxa1 family membrane protein insertase [Chloroflexota bacterium]